MLIFNCLVKRACSNLPEILSETGASGAGVVGVHGFVTSGFAPAATQALDKSVTRRKLSPAPANSGGGKIAEPGIFGAELGGLEVEMRGLKTPPLGNPGSGL